MWSVSTILTGLYSFMIETMPTLGSIETSEGVKRQLARQSLEYNVRDATFRKLFPEYVKIHQKRVVSLKEKGGGEKSGTGSGGITLTVGEGEEEMKGVMAVAAGVVALLSLLFAMRFF